MKELFILFLLPLFFWWLLAWKRAALLGDNFFELFLVNYLIVKLLTIFFNKK